MATDDKRYNGWANYETWVVNLWLREEGSDEMFGEWVTEEVQSAIDADESDPKAHAAYELSKRIEAYVDDMREEQQTAGMFADLLNAALQAVDWREIAEHHTDELELWSAGWNMPGYMPDNAPALFMDADAAREYLADEMVQTAENIEDGTDPECLSDAAMAGDTSELDVRREALVQAAEALRGASGSHEYGQTIDGTHYFIAKA